nr:SURF1 family protein [Qipengyuania sediminis]
MIALGFWQLERRAEKEALLASYAAADRASQEVAWPSAPLGYQAALYSRSAVRCVEVTNRRAVAGRSEDGQPGWAHIATCNVAVGGLADIALGWSPGPRGPAWSGGEVAGMVAPAGRGIRLVANPPIAGLAPLATPDPSAIPNNHLSYAVQWFAFAATAVVIYVLALRRRRGS